VKTNRLVSKINLVLVACTGTKYRNNPGRAGMKNDGRLFKSLESGRVGMEVIESGAC